MLEGKKRKTEGAAEKSLRTTELLSQLILTQSTPCILSQLSLCMNERAHLKHLHLTPVERIMFYFFSLMSLATRLPPKIDLMRRATARAATSESESVGRGYISRNVIVYNHTYGSILTLALLSSRDRVAKNELMFEAA